MYTKREILKVLVVASAMGGLLSKNAWTQPSRPIRFILPLAPGGGTDTIGRQMVAEMGGTLGATIVAENKPGASGTLALAEIARASPANPMLGLTLGSTLGVVPHLIKPLPYDTQRDIRPIVQVGVTPLVLLVNREHPARTLKEFVELAKAHPREQNFGSFGSGTSSHVVGEAFNMTASIQLTHIPYRGTAPAINDLLGKQVQSIIADFGAAGQYLGPHGRLRALAVTGSERVAAYPDVPTFGEQGYPSMNPLVGWIAVVTSRKIPDDIVNEWTQSALAAVKAESVQRRLITLGYVPTGVHGSAFEKIVKEEPDRWGTLIQATGIKLENY